MQMSQESFLVIFPYRVTDWSSKEPSHVWHEGPLIDAGASNNSNVAKRMQVIARIDLGKILHKRAAAAACFIECPVTAKFNPVHN